MIERINKLQTEIQKFNPKNIEEIEKFRIEYLSKKGKISVLFDDFRSVPSNEKKEIGAKINILKQTASEKLNKLKEQLFVNNSGKMDIDLSRPGDPIRLGARHPLSVIHNEIVEIFAKLGFSVSDGPEIEDDNHNFALLNFPENHPARDMQDTFFISPDMNVLLRTHTSDRKSVV